MIYDAPLDIEPFSFSLDLTHRSDEGSATVSVSLKVDQKVTGSGSSVIASAFTAVQFIGQDGVGDFQLVAELTVFQPVEFGVEYQRAAVRLLDGPFECTLLHEEWLHTARPRHLPVEDRGRLADLAQRVGFIFVKSWGFLLFVDCRPKVK